MINGVQFLASADDTYGFIAGLYETASFKFEAVVPWLRTHCR
jgi:hypothetical protein